MWDSESKIMLWPPGKAWGMKSLKWATWRQKGHSEGVRTQKAKAGPPREHGTPTRASLADVQNRLRSWQLARQEQSAMFQDLGPDPGRGQLTSGSVSIGCREFAGKRKRLKVKMRGRREADKHGTEGGKVGRRDSCKRTDQWKKDGKREMDSLRSSEKT